MVYRMILFLVVILCASIKMDAQENETFEKFNARRQESFDKFKEQKQQDFEQFRRKRNEEFAKYLRKKWRTVVPSPVLPRPEDETIPPIVISKDNPLPVAPFPKSLPYEEVIPLQIPEPQPRPIEPIEEILVRPNDVPMPSVSFTYFGTFDKVRFDKKNLFKLKKLNENSIADIWLKMSEESYTNLIHDCLEIRENRSLCDWAYLKMLEKMAESICGKGTNESVLLMAYVYCQSGYKMRLAINGNKLYMMFASDHYIYNWNHYNINGENYYAYNNKTGSVRICEQEYPNEKAMSLIINTEQRLAMSKTSISVHKSSRYEKMNVSLYANNNMLDFYSTYPTSMINDNFVTRWAMYANMPMPKSIQAQIYPQIQDAIKGLDQLAKVNYILNWVQTGFEYEYDNKVWGYDRAFFPEESLHYPYCDCEDRSILFTRIIRDLLNLNCILIYYPGHLAAAVEFTQGTPTGDYIEYSGHRFFITDGTILGYGAPVGQTMPGMDNKSAKIILLK